MITINRAFVNIHSFSSKNELLNEK